MRKNVQWLYCHVRLFPAVLQIFLSKIYFLNFWFLRLILLYNEALHVNALAIEGKENKCACFEVYLCCKCDAMLNVALPVSCAFGAAKIDLLLGPSLPSRMQ
jgi:hypothetical protein